MWHFTPDHAVVKPQMRIVKRLELYPHRVHCSDPGCLWSCPCRDIADAEEVLAQHLTQQHGETEH